MDPRLHGTSYLFDNSRNRADGTPLTRPVSGHGGTSGLAMPISVKELAYRSHNRDAPRAHLAPSHSSPRRSQSAAAAHAFGDLSGGRPSYGGGHDSPGFGRVAPMTSPVYGAGSGLADFDAHQPARSSTSGLANPASERTLSDFALLSSRAAIDSMNPDELYSYASRLKEEARAFRGHLDDAYNRRDQYREELARLKLELHNKIMQLQLANVDRDKYQSTIEKLHEEINALRSQLDDAEDRVRQLTVRNAAQPAGGNAPFYQTQLASKDGRIAQLEAEKRGLEEKLRDALQRALSHDAADDDALGDLKRALAEMTAAKDELARQLTSARDLAGDESADLADKNGRLQAELDRVHAQNVRLQEDVDRLSDALSQRAPLSNDEYQRFQRECGECRREAGSLREERDALKTQVASLEAAALEVTALKESLRRVTQERDDALAKLAQLQARTAVLEDLANSFQQEASLSGEANQLRQGELDRLRDLLTQALEDKQAAEDRYADLVETANEKDTTAADLNRELDQLRHELANSQEALRQVASLAQSREAPANAAPTEDAEKMALQRALDELRDALAQATAQNTTLQSAAEQAESSRKGELDAARITIDELTNSLDAARATNAALQAANRDLEQQLADARAAVDELAAEVASKDKRIDALSADMAGKDRALEQLQDLMHKLEEANTTADEGARTLSDLVSENGSLHAANASLEQQLANALSAVDKLAGEVASKDKEIDALSADVADKSRALEQLREDTRQISARNSAADEASQRERTVAASHADSLRNVAAQLEAAREEEAELLRRVADACAAQDVLRTENASLAKELANARAALDALADELAAAQRAQSIAEKDRDALTRVLNDVREGANAHNASAREDQTALANARAAVQNLAEEVTRLRGALREAENQCRQVKADLAARSASLEAMQSAKKELEGHVAQLTTNITGESHSTETLRTHVQGLLRDLSNAHEAINRLSQQVSNYDAENQQLTAKLAAAHADHQSLSTELGTLRHAVESTTKPQLARTSEELARTKAKLDATAHLAAEQATQLEDLKKQLANSSAALAQLASDYARGQDGLQTTNDALASLRSDAAATQAQLENDVARLTSQLAEQRQQREAAEQGRVDAEAALDRMAADLASAQLSLTRIPELEAELSRALDQSAWLRQELSSTQQALQEVSSQLVSQDTLISRLDSENKSLNDAVQREAEASTALSAHVAALEAQRTDLQEQIAALHEALNQAVELYNEEMLTNEEQRVLIKGLNAALDDRAAALHEAYLHIHDATRAFSVSLREALDRSAYHVADGTPVPHPGHAKGSLMDLLAPVQRARDWLGKQAHSPVWEAASPDGDAVKVTTEHTVRGFVALLDEVQSQRRDGAQRIGRLLSDNRTARAALDELAARSLASSDHAASVLEDLQRMDDRLAEARAEYERQLAEQSTRAAEELVATRLSAERAEEARRRAEDDLVAARAELEQQALAVEALQTQKEDANREKERLTRLTSMLPDADRRRRTTLQPDDLSHLGGLNDNFDAVEQAQMLQISSLQADLLMKRRQVKELESKEAALRETYSRGQQQLADIAAELEGYNDVVQERDRYRQLYEDVLENYNRLVDSTNASAAAVTESRALRQRVSALESELEAEKQRSYRLAIAQSGSAAGGLGNTAQQRQHEALRARTSALFDVVDAAVSASGDEQEPPSTGTRTPRPSAKGRASAAPTEGNVREMLHQLKQLSMDQEKALKAALSENARKDIVIETLRSTLDEHENSGGSTSRATNARRGRTMTKPTDLGATPRAAVAELAPASLLTPLTTEMTGGAHVPSPSPRLPVMPRALSQDNDGEEEEENREESSVSPRLSTVSPSRLGRQSVSQNVKRPRSASSSSSRTRKRNRK